jgi:ubiquinone/menaquinone biosynthesis C-methylase UbiE/predicted RNA-binding Zn-ribbon protein involved in translation (DUF1610 family)
MEPLSIFFLILVAVIALGSLAWWLLITTEGVYLGRRVVVWLYDVYARRYDRIKNYEPTWESATLGRPLERALLDVKNPLVLDVATGTARLPLTLTDQRFFTGTIIGLDFSRKMLAMASEKIAPRKDRISLVHQNAQFLPFDDNTFDLVTCLEALEFMPDTDAVIREIVRVAKPNATILLTNRKGFDAKLMPGRTMPTDMFLQKLKTEFDLVFVQPEIWQLDYQLIWAVKPAPHEKSDGKVATYGSQVEQVLRCPRCAKHDLIRTSGDGASSLVCTSCEARIAIGEDGVIEYATVYGHQAQS